MGGKMRVLWMIWALLTLFVTALCFGIGFYMVQSSINSTETALRQTIEEDRFVDETRGMAMLFLDEHGGLRGAKQSHLGLNQETIERLATQIRENGEQGAGMTEIESNRYRYISVLQGGGAIVAVAECAQEVSLIGTLKRNGVILVLLSMLLLMPVSILLANWVSKPIAIAWEKQNDFVSDATHELKTPLATIAANTEAMLANPEATIECQSQWLDSIHGETTRMAGLVADLLFLAKVDAGEAQPEFEELRISELLEGLFMEREYEIFERGVNFEYALTENLTCWGDWKRLKQMVEAVLDNAVMYTPKGEHIRAVVNRAGMLQITITNTGCPISQNDLPKIFDRFYRVDPSRARDTGGYGLGLCVAKSIAELHGGTITAACDGEKNVFTMKIADKQKDLAKANKKTEKKKS